MNFTITEGKPQTGIEPGPNAQPESPITNHTTLRPRDPWLALVPIVVLGGISAIAYYLGFVRPYRLEDWYDHPLKDLASISGHTASAANSWALTWIVAFACYFLAFRLCPPASDVSRAFRRVGLIIICGWAAFSSINILLMYPVGAADIFDQVFRARLTAHYHLNPFTTFPLSIAGDTFQPYVAWKGDPSPYGPVWEWLAAGTSLLGGDSLWRNLVLFKLLVMAAYGINIALTYGILRVVKPDWALRGTLFFAWNPLVIFEVAGNGHNDSIVVTFLLAGVYMFVLARRYAIIPMFMLGALAKFVPALLIPVAAAAIWRDRIRTSRTVAGLTIDDRRWTKMNPSSIVQEGMGIPVRRKLLSSFDAFSILTISSVIALGLAVVLYAPFWTGPSTVGALGRQSLFTASIPKVVLDVLIYNFHMEGDAQKRLAESIVRNAALALTIAVSIGFSVSILLKGNARTAVERQTLTHHTLSAFYEVIFFYLAFATLWFQPWYLMWLIALTAPVARFTNANRTILFCIGGVLNYFVWDFLWLWNAAPIREIQITSAMVIYTLPLFYTLYVWIRPIMSKSELLVNRNQKSEIRNQGLVS